MLLLAVKDTQCQCSWLGRAQVLGSPLQHPRKGPLSLLPKSGGHNKDDVSEQQPGMGSCVGNK